MFDYVSFVKSNPCGVFGTQYGKKTKTRVFQCVIAEEKKLYFCTSEEKEVYDQIRVNSQVTFCTFPSDYSTVASVYGKAFFVDDKDLKQKVLDENPKIKDIYKSADNETMKLFYIDVYEVVTFTEKEGTKEYKFSAHKKV